jgi:hypothetical protein
MTDSVAVDYGDGMFQIKPVGLCEDAVQQRQHLIVRIRPTSEEDNTRASGIAEQYQPRIVEVSRDDDPAVAPGAFAVMGVLPASKSH